MSNGRSWRILQSQFAMYCICSVCRNIPNDDDGDDDDDSDDDDVVWADADITMISSPTILASGWEPSLMGLSQQDDPLSGAPECGRCHRYENSAFIDDFSNWSFGTSVYIGIWLVDLSQLVTKQCGVFRDNSRDYRRPVQSSRESTPRVQACCHVWMTLCMDEWMGVPLLQIFHDMHAFVCFSKYSRLDFLMYCCICQPKNEEWTEYPTHNYDFCLTAIPS